MRSRFLPGLLATTALLSCTDPVPVPEPAAATHPTAVADALPVCATDVGGLPEPETVAEGLEVPWDVAFLPDGRILVTERPGRIRVIRDGILDPEPWAVLDVSAVGEGGLLGIAVPPDFEQSRHVFVAATLRVDGDGLLRAVVRRLRRWFTAEGGYPLNTAVIRLTDRAGRGVEPVAVVAGIPAAQLHVGGALRIGPRGDLWLGTGDALDPALTTARATRTGTILHYERRASVPRYSRRRSEIYATGLRNVQGIDWDPRDGRLYALDHGPTGLAAEGLRTGMDELNAIQAGVDYGWPLESGRVELPRYRPPLLQWNEAIAPAGFAFWTGDPAWEGDAFVGALAARDLIRIHFDGRTPMCTQGLLQGRFGRIRAVRMSPDGWLYFTTSNRDGRGLPAAGDDRLLRIRPAPAEG